MHLGFGVFDMVVALRSDHVCEDMGKNRMAEQTIDELLTMLASAPDQLDAALASLGASAHDWTTSEIIGHLGDAARYWGARMRLAVHEDNPALANFDQDGLVRLAAYRYVPSETLARQYRLVNESNVAFLRGLTDEQWRRTGVHEERGPITVHQMLQIEANHEQDHVSSLAQSRADA